MRRQDGRSCARQHAVIGRFRGRCGKFNCSARYSDGGGSVAWSFGEIFSLSTTILEFSLPGSISGCLVYAEESR